MSLTAPTIAIPDLEAEIRMSRLLADEYLDRDCERFAQHSGLGVHTIRQLRDTRDDLIPCGAKLALICYAGRQVGRTFAQTTRFLSQVHLAAGVDAYPVTDVVGTIGVERAGAAVLRETAELIATLIERIKDGIDESELPEIEREANEVRTAAARVIREAQAAVRSKSLIRGKKFQKENAGRG